MGGTEAFGFESPLHFNRLTPFLAPARSTAPDIQGSRQVATGSPPTPLPIAKHGQVSLPWEKGINVRGFSEHLTAKFFRPRFPDPSVCRRAA